MKLNETPKKLFVDEICNPPLDKSRLTQIPEQSRLMQLPMDASTLSQLPVDTSRLMRLPPDVSALMRLPIDPNSEVEKEFFGKRLEPEFTEEPEADAEPEASADPELARVRSVRRRTAALVVALAAAACGALVTARLLQPASAPLPAAATTLASGSR